MSYTTKLYRITAQTNIHVGSGKQNYGIIDNLVQKDPVSALPVIHGSSWKGALREFFVQKEGKKDAEIVNYIFGRENYKNAENDKNTAGMYRFFDAHLLSLPVRTDQLPFVHATSPHTLENLTQFLGNVGKKLNGEVGDISAFCEWSGEDPIHFSESSDSLYLEDLDKSASSELKNRDSNLSQAALGNLITGKPIGHTALVSDQILKNLCDDNHLPVVARNSLENGRSANLWYEQIVPRQSVFYTIIMMPENAPNKYNDQFEDLLTGDNLIQIGANASIGYGFCKISEISIN